MSYLELKNVCYSYDLSSKTNPIYAVNDINLQINKGEYVCILGHNGSGKSTLAKLIVGLMEVKSGQIYIDDQLLTIESLNNIRQKVGIVFQNPDNQFVGVTVKDDIAFGLENRCVSQEEMLELIEENSKKVSMSNFLDRSPETLSGGEKQRVAIAGILAIDPEIIIFDEATSMLDPLGSKEVLNIIQEIKKNKTIISITHNLNEAKYADRVIVMKNGEVVMDDTPINVFKNYELLKESSLDILESIKLIEKIKNSNFKDKEVIEKVLWELTYQK